jgi:16S rRNA (guanine(527)-N(7))-methyltransferase RsmG
MNEDDAAAVTVDDTIEISMKKYVQLLMDYNVNVNLMSRKMTPERLNQLLNETLLLNRYISKNSDTIIDAGSGNGILGIPLAIINKNKNKNKNKKIILVEPKKKKMNFLQEVKNQLHLFNVEIVGISIDEYMKKKVKKGEKKQISVVARGFPDLRVFCYYVKKGMVEEAILMTSEEKIKKNKIYLESIKQKTYNVPLRDHLKILKMEKATYEEYEE